MNWLLYKEKLKNEGIVKFRPRGNSMNPLIKSGQLITVIPCTEKELTENDIVFCKVKNTFFIHLIKKINDKQYTIGNNHGKINGIIDIKSIYGKVINIE